MPCIDVSLFIICSSDIADRALRFNEPEEMSFVRFLM